VSRLQPLSWRRVFNVEEIFLFKFFKIHLKTVVRHNARWYIEVIVRYNAPNVNTKKGKKMVIQLAKSAQSVQQALISNGLDCVVKELSASTRTAQEAAAAIGCEVAQIVKSLIFKTKETLKPVLILASGSNRVNEKLIASHLGEKINKADADFAREVTGFAIGGIPPVGHKQPIDYIFIDQDLLKYDSIWAAAGTPNAVFNMRVNDLVEMTNGKVIPIAT
jgi:prolyl-tRNA editing enzyme YbaK/EbsC (Cys-tRNA(Pro) deacylase)